MRGTGAAWGEITAAPHAQGQRRWKQRRSAQRSQTCYVAGQPAAPASQPRQQRPQSCVTVIRQSKAPTSVPHDKTAHDQPSNALAGETGTPPVGTSCDAARCRPGHVRRQRSCRSARRGGIQLSNDVFSVASPADPVDTTTYQVVDNRSVSASIRFVRPTSSSRPAHRKVK